MEYIFQDIESILVMNSDNGDINRYDGSKHKVTIREESIYSENDEQEIRNTMKIRGLDCELKVIIGKCKRDEELEELKFDAYVYSRHGDIYNKWWLQKRTNGNKSLPLKVNSILRFDEEDSLTLVYSRCNDNTMTQQRIELMQYIGGQTHIICETHNYR